MSKIRTFIVWYGHTNMDRKKLYKIHRRIETVQVLFLPVKEPNTAAVLYLRYKIVRIMHKDCNLVIE